MFVALRDLRFARGRFLLIGAVVTLITVLVGFLSGLTGGLAIQNVSAVLDLPGDRIALAPPGPGAAPAFAESSITLPQAEAWTHAAGVTAVEPVGISQARAEAAGLRAPVAVFGVLPTFSAAAPQHDGALSLSEQAAADLAVEVGDQVTVAGTTLSVESISGDGWYSHTPVVLVSLSTWQDLAARTGNPGAYATALAISGEPDWSEIESSTGTIARSHLSSLTALSAFRSEIGSLLLMVTMLFGISGLVIGAFFTVWTMQRQSDIAVLKALGASTGSLLLDSIGQALVVLVLGITLGLGVVTVLGTLAGTALPFLLSPVTTLLPGAILIALGLLGAGVSLRSVTATDPLTALGSNR